MDAVTEMEEEIESEYQILKNCCDHHNLPQFFGAYYKVMPGTKHNQIWLVIEVRIDRFTVIVRHTNDSV